MKYVSMDNLLMTLVFVCYAGASPITTPARRTERFLGSIFLCPRNIQMTCPTGKKFVVHSSRKRILSGCEFDESIMVTTLKKCEDNSFPKACGDRWRERPNNCSSPVLREVVDYAFQGACFLHDLCYLSPYTKKNNCDYWFFHNMKKICSIRSVATRALCEIGARVVYSAVSGYGKCNFDLAKKWTKQNCTECPRNVRMICPTEEKHFVVHSSLKGKVCEFDEPIMVTALRECDNSVMDACRDR